MKTSKEVHADATLAERISLLGVSGSKSQKKLCRFIQDNPAELPGMTAAVLAGKTGVSEATVVRFAKELGFEGYPELQKALRSLLRGRLTSADRLSIAEERMGSNILEATLSAEIRSLRATLRSISPEEFDRTAETILSARGIYIIGTRSSTILADYMYFYMTLILDHVHLIQFATGVDQFEQLLRIGSGDVMIGITFPRYSKRTVDAMSYARECGATTIGITDSESSPLVRLSDRVLYAKNDVASFVDSMVAPIALINALVSELGRRRKDETRRNLSRLEELWQKYSIYDQGNNE